MALVLTPTILPMHRRRHCHANSYDIDTFAFCYPATTKTWRVFFFLRFFKLRLLVCHDGVDTICTFVFN